MELSIIIVNFNTSRLLDICLESVFQSISSDNLNDKAEVIVIDNASTDGSVKLVKEKFSNVVIIENKKNIGFSRANNQGIKIAKGKIIQLLNSDTKISNNTFRCLLNIMGRSKDIGVIGPKLLNPDNTLQYSAGFFPTIWKVFNWMLFIDDLPILKSAVRPYHMADNKFYEKEQYVDWVTGAVFMFRKSIIGRVGLLDEKLFMYGEEMEWCYRIKKKGYKVIYSPQVSVFHSKGGSGEGETAGIIEEYKSIIYFYSKHIPSWQLPILRFLLISGALLRILIFGIIHLDLRRISKYVKAIQVVG